MTATGTGCFLARFFSAIILGVNPGKLVQIFGQHPFDSATPSSPLSFMLGDWSTSRDIQAWMPSRLAFTRTGWLFPFFGT